GDPTARARMWSARHNALMASLALAPGSKAMTTDVAVPVSELAAAIERARRALDDSGLRGGIVGHVGDGNFHVAFLLDPDDAASIERAEALNTRVVEDALARGGTCTGEHGIGYGKLAYLEREHGDTVPLMRGIKQLLDPNGIMNPGKVIPPSVEPGHRASGGHVGEEGLAAADHQALLVLAPRLRLAQAGLERDLARRPLHCDARDEPVAEEGELRRGEAFADRLCDAVAAAAGLAA